MGTLSCKGSWEGEHLGFLGFYNKSEQGRKGLETSVGSPSLQCLPRIDLPQHSVINNVKVEFYAQHVDTHRLDLLLMFHSASFIISLPVSK